MYNDLRSIRKHPNLRMRKEYMGELYDDLEMFISVYSCCEDEVKALQNALLEIYKIEYRVGETTEALKCLHNPRNSGRKKKYTEEDRNNVQQLRKQGYTVREISVRLQIPKSSVQMLLANLK